MAMFQLSPAQVRKEVIQDIESNLVPFIQSSPGLGKSALVKQIAEDYNLELIDIRLSQCAPEDLMGLPMRINSDGSPKAAFVPFEVWPLKGQSLPKGKNGWIIFLDEFNSASKSVQAAAYRPVLDHEIGQYPLHENAFIICAGNLATDRAIVTSLGTAMQSRVIHYEMAVDHKGFMAHAVKTGWDHRILGFLEFQPGKLHSFRPDHQDKTFPCPRTWEFASKKVKGRDLEDISLAGLAGCIGDGTAVELHTFMKEYERLPSVHAIRTDPEGTPVPPESSTKYAVVTMLMDSFKEETFSDIMEYVSRLPPEFQVIYVRGVIQRKPEMRRNKAFSAAIKHLVRYLNDDDDTDDGNSSMASAA